MPSSRAPDVIIVGAGVVGCSIAYHLARAGAAVTVLDQGDICNGMSARSGAIIRMHYSFAPEAELAWKSLRYFANWRDMVGGECVFVKTGCAVVVGPENTARLSANAAMLQGLGIEVSLIDRKQLREQDPA